MKNLIMKSFLLSCIPVLLSGCAEFGFSLSSSSTVLILDILTPDHDARLVPNSTITVSGNCDPLGGNVNLNGSSVVETLATTCDPNTGLFSTTMTAIATGQGLDIQASQLDANLEPLADSSTNIKIHCASDATSELITCTASGAGVSTDPYIINDIVCLQEMRDELACHYALGSNIDASATAAWNGGLGWEPVPVTNLDAVRFNGSLDGRGFTISDLTISQRNQEGTGLFSRIEKVIAIPTPINQIDNLTIINSTLNATENAGILAGQIFSTEMDSINITNSLLISSLNGGTISGVGLMAGIANNLVLNNSSVSGTITFDITVPDPFGFVFKAGGLIGDVALSTINNITSNVTITNTGSEGGYNGIGGLAGSIASSTASNLNVNSIINLTSTRAMIPDASGLRIGGSFGDIFASNISDVCNQVDLDLDIQRLARTNGGFAGEIVESPINRVSNRGAFDFRVRDVQLNLSGGFAGSITGFASEVIDIHSSITSNFVGVGNDPNVAVNVDQSGGFTGFTSDATIERVAGFGSFTTTVSGSSHGDFLGRHINPVSPFSNSANISSLSGGLPTFGSGAAGGVVSGTAGELMVTSNNDYGWDFVNIWGRNALPSLPFLQACPPVP